MADNALRLVTGNRLTDGVPVYFAGPQQWSPNFTDAWLVAEAESAALLAEAEAVPPPHPVVAPYLTEAVVEGGLVRPLSLRERIRAFGPTA
jgi:hypothetical protein